MKKISTSEEFKNAVQDKQFKVSFTKKDGTTRNLYGSCNYDFVIETSDWKPKEPNAKAQLSSNPKIVKVFDLDIGEWRSLDVETVLSLEVL
jgi:hypothetical protein